MIELSDGNRRALEITFGANQIDKAAEFLTILRDDILKICGIAPSVLCVICGMSNAAYKRPDGVCRADYGVEKLIRKSHSQNVSGFRLSINPHILRQLHSVLRASAIMRAGTKPSRSAVSAFSA